MVTTSASGEAPLHANERPEITLAHLRFLATVKDTLEECLRHRMFGHLDLGRDVRPCFLARTLNIVRSISYMLAHYLGASTSPEVVRATGLRADEADIARKTVPTLMWWACLSSWFSAFELAILDLARGVNEHAGADIVPLFRAPKRAGGDIERRTLDTIAKKLSKAVITDEQRHTGFNDFVDVASALRNVIHTHGIFPAWKKRRSLRFGQAKIVCTPGRPLQVEPFGEYRALWTNLLGDAALWWIALVEATRPGQLAS
jgi:hypothetical protein